MNSPDFTKPVDIQAYLSTTFGACGCSELDATIRVIVYLLAWMDKQDREEYIKLFENVGIYYILVGIMDNAGLCEHGTSIRFPWLTDKGRELLQALQTFTTEEIEQAEGKAYDGIEY